MTRSLCLLNSGITTNHSINFINWYLQLPRNLLLGTYSSDYINDSSHSFRNFSSFARFSVVALVTVKHVWVFLRLKIVNLLLINILNAVLKFLHIDKLIWSFEFSPFRTKRVCFGVDFFHVSEVFFKCALQLTNFFL